MLDQFIFYDMTFTWLEGCKVLTDGGTLFGPVPRAVWGRYYPYNENNQMPSVCDPILIQYLGKNYLIDASFNVEKMPEKLIKNTGIKSSFDVDSNLSQLNLGREDIDVVLMTHMHNDHASGLTYKENDCFYSTFPNADIYMSEIEWDEVRSPNNRTKGTYLKENWQAISDQVITFSNEIEVTPGITMEHRGGHSNGLSIVRFEQKDETVIHLSDLLLSCVHTNPLWVGGVDDYPMDSIAAKEELMLEALTKNYRFIFYHDPFYRMIRYTEDGKAIREGMKCSRPSLIPITENQDRFPQEA
ncbi:MBL fold metallo-hydrolase [Facklamia sp. DSM 111018]|uniref:MBL fold metallo-hydrolase n=1 Tax=Facklamia lactis TaxID=2749967 RepID=A0ABS0LQ85_9LACT|nr:MBL fold metallo-hydrolase [Facklamia lactis]MBG9980525.1 MBL fold metallo-hydrolase [Facklamia lactis]MBG9986317.1 MBL fold metallo-hydrolase [Facklamia lactis]